jgi:DNA-binding winged helix-turn-helix (wHTH) protein/tetratricopeptide (TPR) repeat protein/TolB-like protein
MQGTESCPQARRFGVFEVDLRAAELRKRGVRIKLQEQPFQILSLLLEHPGEVVTREELRQQLWPAHTFVDFDRGLNKAMTKLRSALGDSAESPRYVETIPRHGYRFLAPVHTQRDEALSGGEEKHVASAGVGSGRAGSNGHGPAEELRAQPEVESRGLLARLGRRRFFGVAAILVLGFLATGIYLRMRQPVVLGKSVVSPPRLSVAVLGFKNLSGVAQEAWLSTALSDWLTTELTAGEQLRAIPAESVARMKMELSLPDVDSLSSESLVRIRKNIRTDFVVVGSYAMLGAKSDGPIRLDLHLQDTRSGETVVAISEVGTEAHLLDLVARAGQRLREKLGVWAVTREEAAEVAIALPSKPETAKLHSEGLAKLRVFETLSARDLLQQAVTAEPDFALSHAALAAAWAQLGYDENARAEAKTAFTLSKNLSRAERLLVEGRYREMSRDWGRAIEIYRALFDFFPDNLDYGLALANAEYGANRWKDALDTVAALRQLPAPLCDDPRIDLAETDAARSLGDSKSAEAALARAADKAHAAGASLLLAKARREQAWLFENSGKQDAVEGAIREAKQLYVAANDQLGVAAAATLEAIALERHGDYLGAKKRYEESLRIYRVSGNKQSLGNEHNNLGDVLFYLGDLAGARANYAESLRTYQEIGDQNGAALAKLGLGDVSLSMGKHGEAKAAYEEAWEICHQLGNRAREAAALAALARLQRLTGDSAAAWKNEAEAIAMFEKVGDKSEMEHVRVQLAALLLDQGKSSEAAGLAQRAAGLFEEAKAGRYAAEAKLVFSQALLADGRIAEARKIVEQVIGFAKDSHNQELELTATIVAARVQAASGKAQDVKESRICLGRVVKDASAAAFEDVVFEASLALGEVELNSGNVAAGRTRLEALEKDSANAGVLLIARRAASDLQTISNRAAN